MGDCWGVVYLQDLRCAAGDQIFADKDGELQIRRLTDREMRLWLTLCAHRGRNNSYVSHGDAYLADLCGYQAAKRPDGRSRFKGLRQALAVLQACGLIEIRRAPGRRLIYFKTPNGRIRTACG